MPKLYTFKDPNFNPLQNYVVDKTLGQGTFGKVKMGIHKCTNEKVAIKILEKEKIENEADYVRIQREIHILRKIRHPNIIQLYSRIKTYFITKMLRKFCLQFIKALAFIIFLKNLRYVYQYNFTQQKNELNNQILFIYNFIIQKSNFL